MISCLNLIFFYLHDSTFVPPFVLVINFYEPLLDLIGVLLVDLFSQLFFFLSPLYISYTYLVTKNIYICYWWTSYSIFFPRNVIVNVIVVLFYFTELSFNCPFQVLYNSFDILIDFYHFKLFVFLYLQDLTPLGCNVSTVKEIELNLLIILGSF